MFDFFKRAQKQISADQYKAEFKRLTVALWEQFAVEDTPYDQLLEAMASIDNELMRNGGGNWKLDDYKAYLEVIEQHLLSEENWSEGQRLKMREAMDEISLCGQELEKSGSSSRSVEWAVEYLEARVVDWCRRHPRT